MNPLGFFFKKQYVIEEKIQSLLRYLEDMAQLYQVTYESYFDGNFDDLNKGNEDLGKIEKKMDEGEAYQEIVNKLKELKVI